VGSSMPKNVVQLLQNRGTNVLLYVVDES
jgi:hypothetical protein